LKCFAGCTLESIMGTLGLKLADLFPPRTGNGADPKGRIVATHDYTDEAGKLLFQCVRYEPKDFKQRRPDPQRPGTWVWNLKDTRRVLYRLPDVLAGLKKGRTIFVVEGEKDCDALAKAGFVATCNPMGAGKWLPEHAETLRGAKRVVVIPDKDEPGRRHAQAVVSSLQAAAKKVVLIELPDRAGHAVKDTADWFSAGGTAKELKTIVETAPEFVPRPDRPARPPLSVAAEYLPVQEEPNLTAVQPYTPPPLDLLPADLQDFVLSASESLSVERSYILLPLLSALGTAVGNSRIVQLKPGFIQPPIIWSAFVGRTGSKKSPALDLATLAVHERERALILQNREARRVHEEEMAKWETASRSQRGPRPAPPVNATVLLDDLTLAALASTLAENPRGLLVKKDELSHWFASFDQFHDAPGSDVSRWLSLHTGVLFAYDRKTNRECHRLFDPRVCITGGIQPKVLRRCLTEDFFDRGLPARFVFAWPPSQPDRWTEATVPDVLRQATSRVFERLFGLQPDQMETGECLPKVIALDGEAKEEFITFYNSVAAEAADASEREEAAWNKITGYAARFALIGHLTRGDHERITQETMRAATRLARWFGDEAARIYALLAELAEATPLRVLAEYISRKSGTVTVRDLITNYRPLKNQSAQAEAQLNQLVASGQGEWLPETTTPRGGRPSRAFCLFAASDPCLRLQNPQIPQQNGGFADADSRVTLQGEVAEGAASPAAVPDDELLPV
jgi:5S rRNA maturation endonuclease (ribonuclease M5)